MARALGLAVFLGPTRMPLRSRFLLLSLVAACGRGDAPAVDSTRAPAPAAAPAVAPPDSANTPSTRWVVTTRGIGPILAGVALAALDTALSEHLKPTYSA